MASHSFNEEPGRRILHHNIAIITDAIHWNMAAHLESNYNRTINVALLPVGMLVSASKLLLFVKLEFRL
jgi:hypothetical protein